MALGLAADVDNVNYPRSGAVVVAATPDYAGDAVFGRRRHGQHRSRLRQGLGRSIGQRVVVKNRGGAVGTIGAGYVAKA